MRNKNLLVLSSPSGGGKTVIAKYLMSNFKKFIFSVSATTRLPRENEINGIDYHYFTTNVFEEKIQNSEFVEYEQIFGNYYGTLKQDIAEKLNNDRFVIFDVDVKGALSVKKAFPENTLLLFIAPPSIEVLENRLRNRKTESDEQIQKRLSRAEMEISLSNQFDYVVVNDNLEKAISDVVSIIEANFDL